MTTDNVTQKSSKGYKGLPMEGPIASWYAKVTLNDLKRHQMFAAQLAEKIPAGGRVLEIAPGPGYFCIELAKLGNFQITGLDISKSFVEMARKNAAEAGFKIDFRQGNASAMPFADGDFDFTFCQAAFKNFSEPVKAIAEMYRVLRPGGTAVIIDMRHDVSAEEMDREVNGMGASPLNRTLVRWTFKHMLSKNAYTVAEMQAMIAQTPFGKGRFEVGGVGFQVWLEK
jgi:ubiquinone/menaquinone biosynthesis C-methylase UbiE